MTICFQTWLRTGYDTTIKYFESLYGIDENPPVIGLLTERKTKKGNNSKKSKGPNNTNARGASSKNKKIAQKNNTDIVTTVFSLVLRILVMCLLFENINFYRKVNITNFNLTG